MAEKTVKVPEFLREPIEAAQARLENLEEETQKVLKELVQKGRESRKELGALVQKLSKQDWKVDQVKVRLEKLKDHGVELASEWSDRARSEAVDRLGDFQQKAITFLGVASREQVEELSKELERLARKLEKGVPVAAKKPAKKASKRAGAEG